MSTALLPVEPPSPVATPRPRRVNTKRKGSRNERRSMRLLEAAGYQCTKSGASLGVWDIIAIGPTDVILLQCKSRDWPSSVEMETLRLFPAPPNCRKLVHRWRERARLPDVRDLTPVEAQTTR